MKQLYITPVFLFIFLSITLFSGCGKDRPTEPHNTLEKENENAHSENTDRYILMTYDKMMIPAGPMAGKEMMNSYISYFSRMPSGNNISNIIAYNTLKGRANKNGAGIIQSGNRLYRRLNSVNYNDMAGTGINTPVKIEIPSSGRIREIVLQNLPQEGISQRFKNFTLGKEMGFLCLTMLNNANITIHTFNPSSMAATKPSIIINKQTDLVAITNEVLEYTPELKGTLFPFIDIGLHFCVLHDDLLILDIAFKTSDRKDISPNIYLIAVEAKHKGALKGLSVIKNTGLIGNSSESKQHCHDEKGDLYMMCKGRDLVGFYRNSVITRIRKGQHAVDKDWEIRASDMLTSGPVRFNGIFAAKNKIITMLNNRILTSATKDMDLENVWDYYVIDIDTKEAKKIEGLKSCSGFISGANLISEIDGKYFLRYVRTGNDNPYNGYYEYNFETNSVTPAFNVSRGGYAIDLKKVTK